MSRSARSIGELPAIGRAVVCMGVFDGVHDGHRALLAAARRAAVAQAAASVALVFDPHPAQVLRPGTVVPRLAPLDVNLQRIAAAGIGYPIALRFDAALSELDATDFLHALAPAIELAGLAMTPDSAFGRNRGGTLQQMTTVARDEGWQLIEVAPLVVDGAAVSSTRLRAAVAGGDLLTVRALGSVAYLEGEVGPGDRRGRSLGFPTANLAFDYAPVMPPRGIWAAHVEIAERGIGPGYPALVSIGVRPTFHPDGALLVEAHLLDFDADLYGTRLGLELVAFLRDEQRFPSAEALIAQMRRDAAAGRAALTAADQPAAGGVHGASGTMRDD